MAPGVSRSGGGHPGPAHLGILSEMEAMGSTPDLLSRTSAGETVTMSRSLGVSTSAPVGGALRATRSFPAVFGPPLARGIKT